MRAAKRRRTTGDGGGRGLASGARVEEVPGWRRLIKAWGGPLACGPRTGRRAPVGLGRRRRSPGRGRLELGDDKRVPRVSLSGQRRGAAAAAGGPAGPKALAA
jgi:hypothetical protein